MTTYDHNFMKELIDILGAVAMVCGLVGLYLALTYPARFRKR